MGYMAIYNGGTVTEKKTDVNSKDPKIPSHLRYTVRALLNWS
jgi:hypothetical protein